MMETSRSREWELKIFYREIGQDTYGRHNREIKANLPVKPFATQFHTVPVPESQNPTYILRYKKYNQHNERSKDNYCGKYRQQKDNKES